MINLKDARKVKVYQLANKNQFVIEYSIDGVLVTCFQSYSTLIAIYDRSTTELYLNNDYWDYSKTTLKHFKMFLNEWTIYNYESKQQFIKVIQLHKELIHLFKEYE